MSQPLFKSCEEIMRIDKLLSNLNFGSRSEIKKLIKQKQVKLNDTIVKNGKMQIDPSKDLIFINDHQISIQLNKYLMLNKPKNVITATNDASQKTVLDLISMDDYIKNLAPVGRLDKDTTGLLLLTNNGKLAHSLLSPHHHIAKTYRALISGHVTSSTIKHFENGIQLKDGTRCKPAILKIIKNIPSKNQSQIAITITEGKYHQIKRMFAACDMHVETLKRIAMGPLKLDSKLAEGQYRQLNKTEIQQLLSLM